MRKISAMRNILKYSDDPKRHPILQGEAFKVMWDYGHIECNFTGGFEDFIKYIEDNKVKGRVLGVLVEIVTEGIYSTEQLDLICGEGTKLLKLLGDNSTDYFKMFGTGIGRQYKEGISQLLDQPEKFKEAIKEIIDIVSQCGDSFEGQDPRDGILEKTLCKLLRVKLSSFGEWIQNNHC